MTTAVVHRGRVLADLIPGARVRDIALIAGGAGLTGIAAQISVHTSFTPVPFTLQTLSALLVGAALGPLRGSLSLALYLVAGMVGVPWFSEHTSGHSFPSFGYIIGFVAAAALVGFLAQRGEDRSVTSTIGVMVLGNAVIYLIGASWLAADLNLSLAKTMEYGVTPFLVGDAIKLAVAALVLPAAWKFVRR